jgi:hypothetical protein
MRTLSAWCTVHGLLICCMYGWLSVFCAVCSALDGDSFVCVDTCAPRRPPARLLACSLVLRAGLIGLLACVCVCFVTRLPCVFRRTASTYSITDGRRCEYCNSANVATVRTSQHPTIHRTVMTQAVPLVRTISAADDGSHPAALAACAGFAERPRLLSLKLLLCLLCTMVHNAGSQWRSLRTRRLRRRSLAASMWSRSHSRTGCASGSARRVCTR